VFIFSKEHFCKLYSQHCLSEVAHVMMIDAIINTNPLYKAF